MQLLDTEILSQGDRLRGFLRQNEVSARHLAKKIGVSPNTVNAAVNDQNSPRTDFWIKLHEVFPDADLHYLLTGEARSSDEFGGSLSAPVAPVAPMRLWVAHAGDTIEMEALDHFFDLDITEDYPDVSGWEKCSFLIQGESMSPTIEHGEVVMAERVQRDEDYVDGAVYMLRVEGVMVCKRVYIDDGDRTLFTLVSDNPVHRDRRVEQSAVMLWRVRHRITNKNLGGL